MLDFSKNLKNSTQRNKGKKSETIPTLNKQMLDFSKISEKMGQDI
jgi:hypothetical protein